MNDINTTQPHEHQRSLGKTAEWKLPSLSLSIYIYISVYIYIYMYIYKTYTHVYTYVPNSNTFSGICVCKCCLSMFSLAQHGRAFSQRCRKCKLSSYS